MNTAPNDVLLFAGQGSKHHLSDRDSFNKLEKHLGQKKHLLKLFLEQCQEAFRSEYDSLNPEEQEILGEDVHCFEDPELFLLPPKSFQSNPVIQSIALYVRQILELITYGSYDGIRPRVVEVTGVCTGVIPAALAAANPSYDSNEFLDSCIHGFRLVFWVGLRSAVFCRGMLGEHATDSAWVLCTFGWPSSEVEAALSKFQSQRQSVSQYTKKY